MSTPVDSRKPEAAPTNGDPSEAKIANEGVRHILGTWIDDAASPGSLQVTPVVAMTASRYDEVHSAAQRYDDLSRRPVWALINSSYRRVVGIHELHTQVDGVGGVFEHTDRRMVLAAFSSEILNWLALTRLYVQAEEAYAREMFGGEDSEQFKAFKSSAGRAFDEHLGYRFCYQLRNFAQHGGVPASYLRVFRGTDDAIEIEVCVTKKMLTSVRFHRTKRELAVLDALPERISLLPLMLDAMDALELIEEQAVRARLTAVAADAPLLMQALDIVGPTAGNPGVFSLDGPDRLDDYATLPNVPSLNEVVRLAADPQAADAARGSARATGVRTDLRTDAVHEAYSRAGSVLTVLLGKDRQRFTAAALDMMSRDGGALALASGLANVAETALIMLGEVTGARPEALLSAMLRHPDNPRS